MLLARQYRSKAIGSLILFLILFIGEVFVALPPAQAQPKILPAPAPRRVLVLYTYGDGFPVYEKATPAFISVMTSAGINTNDLFFEYLDHPSMRSEVDVENGRDTVVLTQADLTILSRDWLNEFLGL